LNIVVDSGAGLTTAEAQALGVAVVPLAIQFSGDEIAPEAIAPDEFYDRLDAMRPAVPTTAQPSPGAFAQVYRRLAETGPEILSIHISSGLSGTINAARLGAEEALPAAHVTAWDTLTLAGGQRFQVMAAAWASRRGWPAAAILERLAEIRASTEVTFTLETLEYLHRGGRIGRVQALAGMLLALKPVIHVDHVDGKYNLAATSRTLTRAMTAIADRLQVAFGDTPLWVSVHHGRIPEKAEALKEQLGERLNVARMEIVRVPPVLGVHTGPGVVGASVVPMRWLEDLA